MISSRSLQQSTPPVGRSHTRLYIGLVLIAALVLASWFGASYYLGQLYPGNNNNGSKTANNAPQVNVVFNYGNGTIHWYNSTEVPGGSNFYNITVSLAHVDAKYYGSPLNEHLINSINGVAYKDPNSWNIWIYCTKDNAWMYSKWGADQITPTSNGMSIPNTLGHPILFSSSALAWSYQNSTDTTSLSPPLPGASQVDLCSA